MNIIIAGDGKVGSALTRQLSSEGYDITVIDTNPQVLEASTIRYDVMSVQGNCVSMDTLLAAGAQRDPKSRTGWTPLIVAAINGHTDIVKSLIAAGADVNAKDEDDWTPLMQAVQGGHIDTVKALLKAGATGAAEAAALTTDPAMLKLLQTPAR